VLDSAPEDIPQSDEVRALLKSLREARQSKILTGLSAVNSEHMYVSESLY
jgi:GINS complex subunit 2